MSIQKTKQELIAHKESALTAVENLLEQYIQSNDSGINSKADKLCYWLEDYIKFLDFEPQFKPSSLRRYKRGEIVKVHLGYNIGSEEGGLHYAVVLDNNNSINNPVLTILPLTSVKPGKDIANLRPGSIYLGNEIFTNLNSKISSHNKLVTDELNHLTEIVNTLDESNPAYTNIANELQIRIDNVQNEIDFLDKMRLEVLKMKVGSIGLLNQLTTVSKIRIYDPKTNHSVLSGIKLSNEKLDLIDEQFKLLYTKNG